MQTRTITVDYARPRGYDVGYRAENNFTELSLPVPVELEGADSYRVYFESTVGEYLQTELLTPTDGYVTVKITSDVVPEPGNMAAQLVAFRAGEIVGYAPMITGTAKVSIPDGTERLSHSLAAEITLNTAARHSHANKAVLDKFAEGGDGKPTYNGMAIGGGGGGTGGASTAEDVSYSNATLPDVSTVGGALDELVPNSHTHENKDTLDKLSESNGKLQYNGSDVGLKGDKGDTGATGAQGDKGDKGDKGDTGEPGKDGKDGTNGITPTIGSNGDWYLGTTDTGKPSRGEKGEPGAQGAQGLKGDTGAKGDKGDKGDSGSDANVTKANVIAALGYTPKAVSAQVATGTNIILDDNTEYRLTDVTTLTLTYPTGNFECWMRLNFAASGNVTVTLPADTKYIGAAPDFKNGETWELSFKDKVLAAQKVGEGT